MSNSAQLVAVLAPPGSMLSSKVGGIAEAMKATAFNLHSAIEKRSLKKDSLEMINDQDISNIIQEWVPDLQSHNENRLLFGYPKTISQIHHLRKNKIYPSKIFVVNCDEQSARSRVCRKLFGTEAPESLEEQKQIDNIFQQYYR